MYSLDILLVDALLGRMICDYYLSFLVSVIMIEYVHATLCIELTLYHIIG